MGLSLLVLNGALKGTQFPLKKDYVFQKNYFTDPQMDADHAVVSIDHNLYWKINGLGDNKIRVGLEEKSHITLLPDLTFNIGQTGFKVIQRNIDGKALGDGAWEDTFVGFISKNEWLAQKAKGALFLNPLQLEFVEGPQTGEVIIISYGPRILGFNQIDLRIKDPQFPQKLFSFHKNEDKVSIKNLFHDKPNNWAIQMNDVPFKEQLIIEPNDVLSFGSYVINFSYFKS